MVWTQKFFKNIVRCNLLTITVMYWKRSRESLFDIKFHRKCWSFLRKWQKFTFLPFSQKITFLVKFDIEMVSLTHFNFKNINEYYIVYITVIVRKLQHTIFSKISGFVKLLLFAKTPFFFIAAWPCTFITNDSAKYVYQKTFSFHQVAHSILACNF